MRQFFSNVIQRLREYKAIFQQAKADRQGLPYQPSQWDRDDALRQARREMAERNRRRL